MYKAVHTTQTQKKITKYLRGKGDLTETSRLLGLTLVGQQFLSGNKGRKIIKTLAEALKKKLNESDPNRKKAI